MLFGSHSPSVLKKSCGATAENLEAETTNVEAQKVEMLEIAKELEGDFNICSDATLAGLWEGDGNEEEAERGNIVEDGATAASSKDKADKDDFMSLDITEQELQILEREAAKELVNEAAPEVLRKALVNHGRSAEEVIASLISPKILKSSIPERILRWAGRRAHSLENICAGS